MKSIGIKLADGTFYPLLEEGNPEKRTLDLTTVMDNQTKVQAQWKVLNMLIPLKSKI